MRRLVAAWKHFTEAFLFFFKLEKIKYKSSLAASSEFTVTSKKLIIYNGN